MTSRKELFFVATISLFVLALANASIIYGLLTAPEGKVLWDPKSFVDGNSYLAWMRQGAQGNFLFRNLYTSEAHANSFFHPLFLLMGLISRATSVPLVIVNYIARFFFQIGLIIVLYKFISMFIKDGAERVLTFLLTVTAGGFGWILLLFPRLIEVSDAWRLGFWGDANTFLAINGYTLYPASWMLLLLTFILLLKAIELNRSRLAAGAGFAALFLQFVHFYDTLIIFPVMMVYLSLRWFMEKDAVWLRRAALKLAIVAAVSLPAPLYNIFVASTNPVFKTFAMRPEKWLSPNIIWVIGAFGFAGLLAASASLFFFLNHRQTFLVSWIVVFPLIFYAPVPVQSRLIEGVHVVVCILACAFLFVFSGKLNWNKTAAVLVLALISVPATFIVPFDEIGKLSLARGDGRAGYLREDYLSAMNWLGENSGSEDVILCDFNTGNYVPAVSGRTVFAGHPEQTIDFSRKVGAVRMFFDENLTSDMRKDLLMSTGATFIIYGPWERSLGGFDPASTEYASLSHQSGEVKVFKINL